LSALLVPPAAGRRSSSGCDRSGAGAGSRPGRGVGCHRDPQRPGRVHRARCCWGAEANHDAADAHLGARPARVSRPNR